MTPTKNESLPELLPCPFCGGDPERIDFGPGDAENEGGSCIACKRCQSSGPVEFGYKENFISNWNRRAALTREAPTEGVVRDREADRVRYPDKDFNAWLDAGISDAGHTIYDSIGNIADAWQGWFGHVVSVMLDEPEPLFATPTAPQRHPDALEDGSLSKSTAKRVDALRLAQGEDGIIDGVFDEDGALSNWQPWRVFRDDDGYLWLTTDDRERDVEVNDERFAVRYNRPGDLHG